VRVSSKLRTRVKLRPTPGCDSETGGVAWIRAAATRPAMLGGAMRHGRATAASDEVGESVRLIDGGQEQLLFPSEYRPVIPLASRKYSQGVAVLSKELC
jgi:hypothetical protein